MQGIHKLFLILTVTAVFLLTASIPTSAAPPLKDGNPGIPGLLARIADLEVEIADRDATIESMEEDVARLDSTIGILRADIVSLEREVVQLELTNRDLLDENQTLIGWVHGLEIEVEDLLGLIIELDSVTHLARTGQKGCWDSRGQAIACAGTGQDGELRKGVEWPETRFEDNGDGTVTDNLTELIWLKRADCGANVDWEHALAYANLLRDGHCGLTDGSTAGSWRMPNANELLSLVDRGNYAPALPSGHPFTDVSSQGHWTSTTNQVPVGAPCYNCGDTGDAWVVGFFSGALVRWDKSNDLPYLWAVRDSN